jgi:hypothetical protein
MPNLKRGTRLLLEDPGEGWFPLAPAAGLNATVLYEVKNTPPRHPLYVLRLDPALEIQEPGAKTPSSLRLNAYEFAFVSSRLHGVALGSVPKVSAYLFLPRVGQQLPTSESDCEHLEIRSWANCTVICDAAQSP